MEKLQYDSFYKFLVSLGIILIVSPFIGIYYFLINGNKFLISNSEYLDLTNNSLMILEKREKIYIMILNLMPIIIIILFFIGIVSLIYGILKWKKFQKEIDEQTILKTKEQRINLQKMTPTEIVEKAVLEEENYEVDNLSFLNNMKNEDLYFELIKSELNNDYEVFQNIKVGSCHYDIIAMSKKYDIDKIYELKIAKKNINYSNFVMMVQTFKDMVNCYKDNTNRNVVPYLVFIISNCEYKEFTKKLKGFSKKCNDNDVNIMFIYENELIDKEG